MMKRLGVTLLGLALSTIAAPAPAFGEDAKIVLIAGKPSHPKGAHEFNAGMKLLARCLKEVPGVNPVFVGGGWPSDESVFDDAKAVVFFMDGGGGHPIIQGDHLAKIKALMDKEWAAGITRPLTIGPVSLSPTALTTRGWTSIPPLSIAP